MTTNKFRHKLITIAILGVATTSGTGCVEWLGGQGILTVTNALAATSGGQDCVPNPDIALVSGVLDVNFETPYRVGLNVQTNLPSTFTTQLLQIESQRNPSYPNYGNTDTNTVIIEELTVAIRDGDNGDDVPGLPRSGQERRTPASGVVFNSQQALNGTTQVFVNAITAEEAAIIRDGRIGAEIDFDTAKTVIVEMQLLGYTSGGGRVTSSSFTFPIDVCRGCLEPPEFAANAGACPGTTRVTPAICTPLGQDASTTCQ